MNYAWIFKTLIFINKTWTVIIIDLNAFKIFILIKLIKKLKLII